MTMTAAQAVGALHGKESQKEFAVRVGISHNTMRYLGYGESISQRSLVRLLMEARRQGREDLYRVIHDEAIARLTEPGWILNLDVQQASEGSTASV